MATANGKRLERLEMKRGQANEFSHLAADEISVLLLENMLEMQSKGADQYDLRIDSIKADIISTATKQECPEYQQHLEWCRKAWAMRDKNTPFVPAVIGGANGGWGEYNDWDLPNIMERRAALRTLPIVTSLLRLN